MSARGVVVEYRKKCVCVESGLGSAGQAEGGGGRARRASRARAAACVCVCLWATHSARERGAAAALCLGCVFFFSSCWGPSRGDGDDDGVEKRWRGKRRDTRTHKPLPRRIRDRGRMVGKKNERREGGIRRRGLVPLSASSGDLILSLKGGQPFACSQPLPPPPPPRCCGAAAVVVAAAVLVPLRWRRPVAMLLVAKEEKKGVMQRLANATPPKAPLRPLAAAVGLDLVSPGPKHGGGAGCLVGSGGGGAWW